MGTGDDQAVRHPISLQSQKILPAKESASQEVFDREMSEFDGGGV